jgi:trimeric autotransporter adhesin
MKHIYIALGIVFVFFFAYVGIAQAQTCYQNPSGSCGSNIISIVTSYSSIAGGQSNILESNDAFIGGGDSNEITGYCDFSVIGGGDWNLIWGKGAYTLASQSVIAGGSYNTIEADYNVDSYAYFDTIGGGQYNSILDSSVVSIGGGQYCLVQQASNSTIAGGNENAIQLGDYSTIGGGNGNTIGELFFDVEEEDVHATICGGESNFIGFEAVGALIGGGASNTISVGIYSISGADYSTITGGQSNSCAANYGFIGGGEDNLIEEYADSSTIAGGYGNSVVATSSYHTTGSTIGGGAGNVIQSDSTDAYTDYNTIGGGHENTITGAEYSTISGGLSNSITDAAYYAAIPGGDGNTVAGNYSFAAGKNAYADKANCFVWSDGSNPSEPNQGCYVTSIGASTTNAFVVRATGGIELTLIGNTRRIGVGHEYIKPASSGWNSVSDYNMKKDVQEVDPREVLEHLVSLPVATWRYRNDPSGDLFMGPMAQDFYAAFKLGGDDRHINNIDAEGVALAAIKGAYSEIVRRDETIHALSARVDVMEKTNLEATTRAASLEQANAEANRRVTSLEHRLGQIEAQLLELKK